MVNNWKPNDATDATESVIGQEAAGLHGQSHTDQTEVVLHLPTPHMAIDQGEQVQMEQLTTHNENPTDYIYQVSNNDYECELELTQTCTVKGNLKRHIKFWQSIGTSSFILSIINNGYKIPFNTIPPKNVQRNNRSALQYAEFVDQAISHLIQSYRIVRTGKTLHIVNPLSVSVQPSGKLHLILDLRHVNQYVAKNTVKYEDWRTGLTYFKKDYFMISFDLKSGYHHIDIHPESQTFLGFAFTVLPFGLTSAPYIFTKCLKPLEKYWRRQGIGIALCLDDGWLTEAKYEDCINLSKESEKILKMQA